MIIKDSKWGGYSIDAQYDMYSLVEPEEKGKRHSRVSHANLEHILNHIAHLRLIEEGPKEIESTDYLELSRKIRMEVFEWLQPPQKETQESESEEAVGIKKI